MTIRVHRNGSFKGSGGPFYAFGCCIPVTGGGTTGAGTATRTAPTRTVTVATPTNTTLDATLIALARLAERELRGTGGYARWQVQQIRAVSANGLVILTRLDSGPAAQRAATGICTSLFNPSVTAINVDKVTVIAGNGREILSSACKAQQD